MSGYLWNEKNNIFTWLSSLYNPFKTLQVLVYVCLTYSSYNQMTKTLVWRRSLSYRNQSIDLLCKSVDWFLYNRDLRHES